MTRVRVRDGSDGSSDVGTVRNQWLHTQVLAARWHVRMTPWHSRACTTSPRSPATRPRNVDFYARLLGLRLVKKTVNFDAPDVYHLYYGDEIGHARLDPHVLRVPRRGAAAARATA